MAGLTLSATAGIIGGTCVYLYFQLAVKAPPFTPVLFGLAVSLALTVLVSLIVQAPEDSKTSDAVVGKGD